MRIGSGAHQLKTAGPRRASIVPGDDVEWTNGSCGQETVGSGQVVHVHGEHAVVLNPVTAHVYPHLSPYIAKRLTDLRVTRGDLAA